MFEEGIPVNICRDCRRRPSGTESARMSVAEGCGHAVAVQGNATHCYCDFCASQRGVCTKCGGSMSTDPSARGASRGEGGARFTASAIILSAVALLAVVVVLYLLNR
jgi:hypothetical protein